MPRLTTACCWTLLVLTFAFALGCKGNDNNGNPGLYPFQLPINTGLPTRTDPRLVSIRLEPGGGLDLQIGTGVDVRAIGTFSDGLVWDITALTTFQQTNALVGTLSAGGAFRATNPGATTIFAQVDTVFSDALFIRAVNLITSVPRPVQGLDGTILPGNVFRLRWDASPADDAVIGYVIYRSRTNGGFTFVRDASEASPNLIQADPVVTTTFTDETAVGGVVYYVVQAIRRDINDSTKLVYGDPSRQLKVNFATETIGDED